MADELPPTKPSTTMNAMQSWQAACESMQVEIATLTQLLEVTRKERDNAIAHAALMSKRGLEQDEVIERMRAHRHNDSETVQQAIAMANAARAKAEKELAEFVAQSNAAVDVVEEFIDELLEDRQKAELISQVNAITIASLNRQVKRAHAALQLIATSTSPLHPSRYDVLNIARDAIGMERLR